jgi:hypothetical protein
VRVVADEEIGRNLRDRLYPIARHRHAVLDRPFQHPLHLGNFISLLRGETRGLRGGLRRHRLLRRDRRGRDRSGNDDRC